MKPRGSYSIVEKKELHRCNLYEDGSTPSMQRFPGRASHSMLVYCRLPGSSLINSDEAASRETGKDTDFAVVMSGEPQGGTAIRRREPREE